MKPTVLIPTLAAVAGFGLGWLLKPSEPTPATQQAQTEKPAGRDGKSHDRLVLPTRPGKGTTSGGGGGEPVPADSENVKAHVAFERSFRGALERTEKARLERFAEALGLNAEQEEAIAKLLASRRDGFRDLAGGGKTAADMVSEAAHANQVFQSEVEKILDPEQVDALKAKVEREKEGAVQASAYRDAADISSQLDLSPEQREQALQAFAGTAKAAQEKRPEGWAIMSETFGILGGANSSVLDDMGPLLNNPDILKDSQEMYKFQVQARRDDLERKVAQMSSILTPAQLAQYRATLNSRLTVMEKNPPPSFRKP